MALNQNIKLHFADVSTIHNSTIERSSFDHIEGTVWGLLIYVSCYKSKQCYQYCSHGGRCRAGLPRTSKTLPRTHSEKKSPAHICPRLHFSIDRPISKHESFCWTAHPWWTKLDLEPTTKIGLATTFNVTVQIWGQEQETKTVFDLHEVIAAGLPSLHFGL